MYTAQDILKRLAALKAIAPSDLTSSLLVPQQADRFIRVATEEPNILNRSRRYIMNNPSRNIDRLEIGGDVLNLPANIATVDTIPTNYTNTLNSYEVVGIVGVEDATVEENIERDNFMDTVLEIYGRAVGLNIEKWFLTADTNGSGIYQLTDGWLKRSANQLDGDGSPADFDPEDVEDMFDKMIQGTPKRYFGDLAMWAFYTTWKIKDDYHNVLRARQTNLGDSSLVSMPRLFYKGIEVIYNSNMPTGTAWLTKPDNTVYGLYRDIRLEPDRIPRERKTDMVLTLRGDANYDDENASTVAIAYTGAAPA
jgi:hypothetical protein